MNDSGFNSRLISNAKRLFSETVSPKTHVQIFLDKKCYHRALIFSFTATPPYITTATHIWEQIYSPSSNMRNCFATKLFSSFGVTYQENFPTEVDNISSTCDSVSYFK